MKPPEISTFIAGWPSLGFVPFAAWLVAQGDLLIAVLRTGAKTPAFWPAFGRICSICCAVIGIRFSPDNKKPAVAGLVRAIIYAVAVSFGLSLFCKECLTLSIGASTT